ncbi:MAG: hypothetical protein EBT86_00885 [Actinobacteria bacterium]|nr:hypothetical protein [Actinomycetota bacterium]
MKRLYHPLVLSSALNLGFLIPFIKYGLSVEDIPYILLGLTTSIYAIYWNIYELDDDENTLIYKSLVILWLLIGILHIPPAQYKFVCCMAAVLTEAFSWLYYKPLNKDSTSFERDTILWQIIHSTNSLNIATLIVSAK